MIEPGVAEGLSTLEVGSLYRLVRFAWHQEDPCTLPDEDSSLAMVAGITSEDWRRLRPRLFLALAATGCTPGGRLRLQHARRVFDDQASRASSTSAAKRAAGLAGARARWQQDGRRMADDGTCHSRAMQVPSEAPSVRSERSSDRSSLALPLQRSSSQGAIPIAPLERSGASGEEVIAIVGEGARAILTEKAEAWRRAQSLGMLQSAIAKWRAAGFTSCPVTKASELSAGRYAEPARVEALIEEADALVAQAKACGKRCNPVGFLIHGLGASERSRGRPSEIPLFVSQKWSKLQAATLKSLEAQAALHAKLRQASAVIQSAEKAARQHGA